MENIDLRHEEIQRAIDSVVGSPSGSEWIKAEANIQKLMLRSLEDSLDGCTRSLNSNIHILGTKMEESTTRLAGSVDELRESLLKASRSSEKHAASLTKATWTLVAATIALFLAALGQVLTQVLK